MTDKRIDEAALRKAWRRHTAAAAGTAEQLEPALRGLQDGATASELDTSVGRLAEDARAADLGRALRAIHADARELETAVIALRQRRPRRLPRIALALAASLALAVVLAPPQWRAAPVVEPAAEGDDSLIASSSFEAGAAEPPASESGVLFRGGFDS